MCRSLAVSCSPRLSSTSSTTERQLRSKDGDIYLLGREIEEFFQDKVMIVRL